jgi:hypothetical protein
MLRIALDVWHARGKVALLASIMVGCGADSAQQTDNGPATLPAIGATAAAGSSAAAVQTTQPVPPSAANTQPARSNAAAMATPTLNAAAANMPASVGTTPATPGVMDTMARMDTPANTHKMAMDECGLHTNYPGDEYCILPPPAAKGFQIHIGPSNYDNPEPEYILPPGAENVINLSAVTGNEKDVLYYFRQYRMRPGSHHVIISANGKSIGGTQNLARDQPDFGIIPPENEDVGIPLAAKSPITANMHFYNFTDKPMVRELWVNYWYKDPAEVKETANRIFSPTSVNAAVAHSHVVVGASCAVEGTGRLLALSGHRHLNNVRFSVWLNSKGKRDLVFDDYDSEHPGELEFNSDQSNAQPHGEVLRWRERHSEYYPR